jgi:glucose-1-phosphate adenylyltransferase
MEKSKSVIMVGGKGERLWPLTETRPKPNVYMGGNKRILEYIFDEIVGSELYSTYLASQYRREDLRRYFEDGSSFIYDDQPLRIIYAYDLKGEMNGTADSVRKSRMWVSDIKVRERGTGLEIDLTGEEKQRFIEEKFAKQPHHWEILSYEEDFDNVIVSSGDALTNLNYRRMMDFHKKNGAFVTVAIVKVPLKRLEELGAVSMTEEGKIIKFYEKENPEKLPKDLQQKPVGNMGIYIFDKGIFKMLSKMEKVLDWGHDFFHRIDTLGEEFPEYRTELSNVFGFLDSDPDFFWDDIGTIKSYHNANMLLIDGIPGINTFSRKVTEQESNTIKGTVKHSLIGRGCKIYGTIEDCVLGNDVYVGKDTHLKRCILNSEAKICGGQEGEGWIVDRIAEIKEGAQIGKDVVIGKGSTILSGAKVKDKTRIGTGMNIDEEIEGDVKI